MQSTRAKLIQLLAVSREDYISGQALSEQLQISRSAIWKHMKALETEGYVIEAKPKVGYRILNYPNEMNEYTLRRGLETNWLAKTLIHKPIVSSTQDIAHELAKKGAEHGTIILANEQTKGKGRMNRAWYSKAGKGIWLSMILRPSIYPYEAPQLTLLSATVIADAIKKMTNLQPQIKWPNDVLINGKKIAGILTEMHAEQDQIHYVVIGIGLNVNQEIEDIPAELQHRASSIQIESNEICDIRKIAQNLLAMFEKEYEAFIHEGFSKVKNKWESYGYKMGERVWLNMQNQRFQALFLGIAEDGALLMQTEDEDIKRVYSAEIEWFKED